MPNPSQNPLQSPFQAIARRLLQHVAEHGVVTGPQLAEHGLLELADHLQLPALDALRQEARAARRALLARELLHRQCLERLHRALIEAGVAALLIKGEALACNLYLQAALRPRHDIDVWIAPADRSAVEHALAALGASPVASAYGQWIQPEQLWRLPSGQAMIGVDLHWQFCSRPALLAALPVAAVLGRSTAFAGDAAVGLRLPDPVDSLLLACIHRRAHHRGGERWIWLADIALLWESLSVDQRGRVVEAAISGGVAALLADGLQQVAYLLSEPVAAHWQTAMQRAAATEPARLLLRSPAQYGDLRFDVRFARGRQRLAVLRDYLLPRADYMRARYAVVRPAWLPWLYLRRLLLRLT